MRNIFVFLFDGDKKICLNACGIKMNTIENFKFHSYDIKILYQFLFTSLILFGLTSARAKMSIFTYEIIRNANAKSVP